MQRCECTVRLNGDIGNTVRKAGVSPAEIVVLRHIHGGDETVVDIQPTGMDKSVHADERRRLAYIYGDQVLERVFPGAFAKLPVSLKDVEPQLEESDVTQESEEEDGDQEEVAVNGVVERMEATDPKPGIEDDLTPDDKALIGMIQEAKSKGELRVIAEDNEVDVASLPDKLPDIKLHLIRSLFPMYKH